MRLMFLLVLCCLLNACNSGDYNHRTYVISKSQETAAETENVTEPQAE